MLLSSSDLLSFAMPPLAFGILMIFAAVDLRLPFPAWPIDKIPGASIPPTLPQAVFHFSVKQRCDANCPPLIVGLEVRDGLEAQGPFLIVDFSVYFNFANLVAD